VANVNITKRAIQEAFLAVLNEKSLGKITVKDITDRCGINRNTFYYHFADIPALAEIPAGTPSPTPSPAAAQRSTPSTIIIRTYLRFWKRSVRFR